MDEKTGQMDKKYKMSQVLKALYSYQRDIPIHNSICKYLCIWTRLTILTTRMRKRIFWTRTTRCRSLRRISPGITHSAFWSTWIWPFACSTQYATLWPTMTVISTRTSCAYWWAYAWICTGRTIIIIVVIQLLALMVYFYIIWKTYSATYHI